LLHGLTSRSQINIEKFWYVQEVEVNDEDIIQQLMEHSNANRSTGSTGANSESSRSHSIMQVTAQICLCKGNTMHASLHQSQMRFDCMQCKL